jgi:hypothetical protein
MLPFKKQKHAKFSTNQKHMTGLSHLLHSIGQVGANKNWPVPAPIVDVVSVVVVQV